MTGKKYILAFWLRTLVSMFVLLIMPQLAFGQLLISEIQYNPDGADGGYEWIELHNDAGQSLSVEGFIFRESDQNHRLVQIDESLGWHIPANGYAVVADNPTKFFEKHPGFPGLIFDSSFSLLNTGELLEILDSDGELLFGFSYNPIWGGDGDGSTLGLIQNSWVATNPTPGYTNSSFISSEPDNETENPEINSTDSEVTEDPVSNAPQTYITLRDPDYKEKTIKADGGDDRTLLAGVPFSFSGTGYGLAGGVLETATFRWNFGDGTRSQGESVIHSYTNPGTYIGSLKVTSGNYSHVDQFEVTVLLPDMRVIASIEDSTIAIQNFSNHTIEISGFKLRSGSNTFVFPPHSFIKGKSQITLPISSLDLHIQEQKRVYLLAPDNNVLDSYFGLEEQIKDQITLLEQEVEVLEQSSSTKEADNAILPTEFSSEPQIVYIGVPQYVEGEETGQEVPAPTETLQTTGQAAKLPAIKKEFLSPFELLLIVLLTLGGVVFGYYQYHKRPEKLGIEIEEV